MGKQSSNQDLDIPQNQQREADGYSTIKNIDKTKLYWLAPGSNRYVWKDGNFQTKASTAYNLALEAIKHENNGRSYSSKQKWREIYGSKFPS